MPATVIFGDGFLAPRRLAQLEAEQAPEGVLDANRHRLQGSRANPAEVLSIVYAIPFMDDHRVIVMEGLLGTAESSTGRQRSGRRAASADSPVVNEWRALADGIPNMPESTVLTFIDGPLSGNNPLLRLLRPVCQVEELSAPRGEALARWTKEAAEAKGAAISPSAIRSLTDLVGNDLWTLEQELEKLSLYVSGRGSREIAEADVQSMVSQVREASIFVAVDAMIDGRPTVALRLLHDLKEDGREAPYIISMVERQLTVVGLGPGRHRSGCGRRRNRRTIERILGFRGPQDPGTGPPSPASGYRLALQPVVGGRPCHQAGATGAGVGPGVTGGRAGGVRVGLGDGPSLTGSGC